VKAETPFGGNINREGSRSRTLEGCLDESLPIHAGGTGKVLGDPQVLVLPLIPLVLFPLVYLVNNFTSISTANRRPPGSLLANPGFAFFG